MKKDNNLLGIVLLAIDLLLTGALGIKVIELYFVFMFLATIPVVILTVKYKEAVALIVSLVVFSLLLIGSPLYITFISFILCSIIGISIGYALRNKFSLKLSVLVGMTAVIISIIISNLLMFGFGGVNYIHQILISNPMNFLESNKDNIIEFLKGNNPPPDVVYYEAYNKLNTLFLFIPAFITGVSLIVSYFIIILSVPLIKKMGNNTLNIEPFSKFKLPIGFGLAFVISQIVLWSQDINVGSFNNTTVVFSNMVGILTFAFMIQGLALMDFYLKKIGLKGTLRVFVYIVGGIVLFPIAIIINLPFILILAGILDYLLDFRKLEAR